MRIAYLALYQGPELLKRRPIVLNRSLANSIKIELIAGLLRANSCQVEILSQGEVVEPRWNIYPSFREPKSFHPDVPIAYSSALPVRRLNALWSSLSLLRLFRARHRAAPFDLAIIHNLKHPQLTCAKYAVHALGIPVLLEYEDDAFVRINGAVSRHSFGYQRYAMRVLNEVSGGMACSPRLLSQLPPGVPKLLLRGVVGADLVACRQEGRSRKQQWVLFCGTHSKQYGLHSLITAWGKAAPLGWELHITGDGPQSAELRKVAGNHPTIRFHGLVGRPELVGLICSASICINAHEISQTPGNVFAFKVIEYLAAGAHVISTPMGTLERDIERGITYMPDNHADTIAATVKQVITARQWERTAAEAAIQAYGPAAVSRSLEVLIGQALAGRAARGGLAR
jgi:glycosyltransferase involved in cell wall biosynthesis